MLEDEDNLAKLMQEALSMLALPVVQLRSAEEGMLLLNDPDPEECAPVLFIVDIHLEGLKTGWDFLSYLHADNVLGRLPVIVSTALEPPVNYQEKEIERYMKKPFTMERLVQVARQLLEDRSATSYVFPGSRSRLDCQFAEAERH